MKILRTPALVCAMVAGDPAHAARPLLTDDARIVDPGACQVESWLMRQGRDRERWVLPACHVGGNSEWALGGRQSREISADAHAQPGQMNRTQALQAQYKTVGSPWAPGEWAWATAVGVQALSRRTTPYAYLALSRVSLSEGTLLHLNVGLSASDSGGRPHRTWGLAMEQRWTSDIWVIGERTSASRGSEQSQVGLRGWLVADRLQVDVTQGLKREAGLSQRFHTIGVRWIFTPSS